MAKLYPPVIGGTIPAYYGNTIKVPFQMNRLVGRDEFNGFKMMIKNVSSGNLITTLSSNTYDIDNGYIIFNVDNKNLIPKMYYKAQIAYSNKNDIGFYSNISTIKFTLKPIVDVVCEKKDETLGYSCEGIYKQEDVSEKILSYKFDIYDDNLELFESSGECTHYSLADEISTETVENNKKKVFYKSVDRYTIKKTLLPEKIYEVHYTATTVNGLVVSATSKIFTIATVHSDTVLRPRAIYNKEEGYVKIVLDLPAAGYTSAGNYVLKRKSSKNNYETSELIYSFITKGEPLNRWSWNDYTVENGYDYIYLIQQYNDNNVYSQEETTGDPLRVNFEHMFLYDGEKQLKIKFDPKISSFKKTVLETKVDTIGSQYPFFFRNEKVSYKEFPISGLISYHSDNEKIFMDWETQESKDFYEQTEKSNPSRKFKYYNQADNDIIQEHQFKMAVLEWLSNGKPKVFKSPTEGSYIIRLMNVSLTPNDTLGRMIHSFQATAYEVAEYNYINLINMKFLTPSVLNKSYIKLWKEVQVKEKDKELISFGPAISLDIRDVPAGTKFLIQFDDGRSEILEVGLTGEYHIAMSRNIKITSLQLQSLGRHQQGNTLGSIIYCYNGVIPSDFNCIKSATPSIWKSGTTVGACNDLIGEIVDEYKYTTKDGLVINTRERFSQFNKFGKLRFFKRPVQGDIYYTVDDNDDFQYYSSVNSTTTISDFSNYNPLYLYRAINKNGEITGYFDLYQSNIYRVHYLGEPHWDSDLIYPFEQKDGDVYFWYVKKDNAVHYSWKPKHISEAEFNCQVLIDGVEIDLEQTGYYNAPTKDFEYKNIVIGPGVWAEYFYKTTDIEYDLDLLNSSERLKALKKRYELHSTLYDLQSIPDLQINEQDENMEAFLQANGLAPDRTLDWPYGAPLKSTIIYRPGVAYRLACLNSAKRAYLLALAQALEELKMGKGVKSNGE